MKDSILYGNSGIFRYLNSNYANPFLKTASVFLKKLAFNKKPLNDNTIVISQNTSQHSKAHTTFPVYNSKSVKEGFYDLNKNLEKINLVEILKHEIEIRKELKEVNRNIRIEFDCDLKECIASFTKEHLKFVISNLIDNAIKHSGDDLIIISMKLAASSSICKYQNHNSSEAFKFSPTHEEDRNKKVYIAIRDYGPGLNGPNSGDDHLSFSNKEKKGLPKFSTHQYSSVQDGITKFDNMALLGFSLSVIKKIMQLHDNKIWIRNNADMDVDCGAVFEFAMPIISYKKN